MKKDIKEVVFVNNTVAPYRLPLFNCIYKILDSEKITMKAVFLCEKESVRDWSIDYSSIKFNYEVLPVLFQKRNSQTTTSDIIVNNGFLKYLLSDCMVLFGYNYPTYLMLIFIRKLLLRKTILFSESTLSDKSRNNGALHKVKSLMIKYCFSSYIVPGKEAQKFIESFGVTSNRIIIAENAVKPFSRIKTIVNDASTINFLYVGRLAEEKNVDFIIKNIPVNTNFNYRLTIVGSGPEEDKLKSIKTKLPIEFRGFQEGDELAKIFKECDVFILASNSEPWGLVINEAINEGLAVLVSDRVGCRHELVDNNGRIFKLNNVAGFKKQLQYVSENLLVCKKESLKISEKITVAGQAKKMVQAVLNA